MQKTINEKTENVIQILFIGQDDEGGVQTHIEMNETKIIITESQAVALANTIMNYYYGI